ncbi:MAG: hypothetical protein M1818_006184 [Claussenomyces sp. TS43310]|nr:MAG: hypothetical protein M1818_006184 [Claussenomyces sp. TS43310]
MIQLPPYRLPSSSHQKKSSFYTPPTPRGSEPDNLMKANMSFFYIVPIDIRIIIYDLVFVNHGRSQRLLAALRVQPTLYYEALDIYRKLSVFRIKKDNFDLMNKLSNNVLLNIRRVKITISDADQYDRISQALRGWTTERSTQLYWSPNLKEMHLIISSKCFLFDLSLSHFTEQRVAHFRQLECLVLEIPHWVSRGLFRTMFRLLRRLNRERGSPPGSSPSTDIYFWGSPPRCVLGDDNRPLRLAAKERKERERFADLELRRMRLKCLTEGVGSMHESTCGFY